MFKSPDVGCLLKHKREINQIFKLTDQQTPIINQSSIAIPWNNRNVPFHEEMQSWNNIKGGLLYHLTFELGIVYYKCILEL